MPTFWRRVAFAFRCFLAILVRGEIPSDIARTLAQITQPAQAVADDAKTPAAVQGTPTAKTAMQTATSETPDSFDRAVQLLTLLQRDGRLVDFFTEDISSYPDDQIGAAVRDIHTNCRQVLTRYLKLEPITSEKEDQPYTVAAGFDPASIKLIGNVKGEPPIRGILRHRGWRVKGFDLPSLPQSSGRMVVAPAEVEIV